jgi:hypothetical protein
LMSFEKNPMALALLFRRLGNAGDPVAALLAGLPALGRERAAPRAVPKTGP